jgi:hypothetical protein
MFKRKKLAYEKHVIREDEKFYNCGGVLKINANMLLIPFEIKKKRLLSRNI